jgi:hypothetical protein
MNNISRNVNTKAFIMVSIIRAQAVAIWVCNPLTPIEFLPEVCLQAYDEKLQTCSSYNDAISANQESNQQQEQQQI